MEHIIVKKHNVNSCLVLCHYVLYLYNGKQGRECDYVGVLVEKVSVRGRIRVIIVKGQRAREQLLIVAYRNGYRKEMCEIEMGHVRI